MWTTGVCTGQNCNFTSLSFSVRSQKTLFYMFFRLTFFRLYSVTMPTELEIMQCLCLSFGPCHTYTIYHNLILKKNDPHLFMVILSKFEADLTIAGGGLSGRISHVNLPVVFLHGTVEPLWSDYSSNPQCSIFLSCAEIYSISIFLLLIRTYNVTCLFLLKLKKKFLQHWWTCKSLKYLL